MHQCILNVNPRAWTQYSADFFLLGREQQSVQNPSSDYTVFLLGRITSFKLSKAQALHGLYTSSGRERTSAPLFDQGISPQFDNPPGSCIPTLASFACSNPNLWAFDRFTPPQEGTIRAGLHYAAFSLPFAAFSLPFAVFSLRVAVFSLHFAVFSLPRPPWQRIMIGARKQWGGVLGYTCPYPDHHNWDATSPANLTLFPQNQCPSTTDRYQN